ncbi:casein kinase II subunit alpha, chloroplastic-like [Gossypium australe]|uniref:Casein kinase II subunit alpha, chloroplastic-like n=1 Tax=Gossypium australe TaxID=47621 RepID=A0A5B6WHH4_9ROSI|nr:casein kinase II subunit alpha, chloroplastic-like [Gossypium australe]
MLRKCPHHGLQVWLQIQIFYNGVDSNIRSSLDRTAEESIMFHTYERAYKIIDNMTMNLYMWPNERFTYKSKLPTGLRSLCKYTYNHNWKDHLNFKWGGNQGDRNQVQNQPNPYYQPPHLQQRFLGNDHLACGQ